MFSPLAKTSLALAAACALWAGGAQAAVYNLNLTGTVANGSTSFQIIGPTRYDQWVLSLDGLDELSAITVEQGDTINATVTLDQLFTVPGSVDLTVFGLFFGGGAFPGGDTAFTGSLDFYDGLTLVKSGSGSTGTSGQLANTAAFFPPDNGAFSFDSFQSSFVIDTLSAPARLTYSLASYTLFSPSGAAAVPEPASWAMMIAGFGGVGALLRRRRGGGLAAFA